MVRRTAHPAFRARGFSLIELIATLIVMAVLLGVALPRFAGVNGRETRAVVEALTDLLSIAAHKDAVGGRAIGVRFTADKRRVELLTRDMDPGAAWRVDDFVRPVDVSRLTIESVRLDGRDIGAADRQDWFVDFPPALPRPPIEVTVRSNRSGDDDVWRIELLPYATSATLSDGEAPRGGMRAIDLDAAGLEDAAW